MADDREGIYRAHTVRHSGSLRRQRKHNNVGKEGAKAMGVHALAVELGCSDSTVYSLMRTTREEDGSSDGGVLLRDAIVSRIGRRIVFDVERVRELAKQGRER